MSKRSRSRTLRLLALTLFGALLVTFVMFAWNFSDETTPTHKPEPEPCQPRVSKFAILSFFCGPPPDFVQWAIKNRKEYAERHGYEFVDLSDDPETQKGCEWSSVMYRYTAMARILPNYDGVLWSDLDALFLNFSRTIDEIMDPRFDLFLTVAPDSNARYGKYSNNGHLFVRNTKWGRDLLDELVELAPKPCTSIRGGDPEYNLIKGWLSLCQGNGHWTSEDQGLLNAVLRNHSDPNWGCHVKYMPFRAFNSDFPWYLDGDLIVHFPARSTGERESFMRQFLEASDRETGIVNTAKYPDLLPQPDDHINRLVDLNEVIRLYDIWNSPCPERNVTINYCT